MSISDLQNVFNKVLAGETVYILFATKGSYEGTRVALLRKFRNLKRMLDDVGAESPYHGRFLRCNFEKNVVRGKFMLATDEERQNTPGKTYTLEDF